MAHTISPAAERTAQEVLTTVFGSFTGFDYDFDHGCPETKPELEIEVANCEAALRNQKILPSLAVGVIRARYRVAVDRLGIISNPAFRRTAPMTPARAQYDLIRKRMIPLHLEPEWLDFELERHGVNTETLEGWTRQNYEIICANLKDLEKGVKKVDAENRRAANPRKKKETEKQVSLSTEEIAIARSAFNFLDQKGGFDIVTADLRLRVLDGEITESELEGLVAIAMDAEWDPDADGDEEAMQAPEIPMLLDVVQQQDVDGKTQPQEVDHVAQPEPPIQLSLTETIDVETLAPTQVKSDVDAVQLPAVVTKDTAEQPVQVTASVVVFDEKGRAIDSETGEILISMDEANALLGSDIPGEARQCAIRAVAVINRLQHECEDIASVASGMNNDRLRGINGLLYYYNATIRSVYEPELKRDEEGKVTTKNIAILEAGCKIYFERTGGINVKNAKELKKMLEALPEKDFLALGGKLVKRREWDTDELKKLYEAGEELLQPYFETKKEDELGLLKVGTGRAGWTPHKISQSWKLLKKLPMLTAATEEQEDADSGESAA